MNLHDTDRISRRGQPSSTAGSEGKRRLVSGSQRDGHFQAVGVHQVGVTEQLLDGSSTDEPAFVEQDPPFADPKDEFQIV